MKLKWANENHSSEQVLHTQYRYKDHFLEEPLKLLIILFALR